MVSLMFSLTAPSGVAAATGKPHINTVAKFFIVVRTMYARQGSSYYSNTYINSMWHIVDDTL